MRPAAIFDGLSPPPPGASVVSSHFPGAVAFVFPPETTSNALAKKNHPYGSFCDRPPDRICAIQSIKGNPPRAGTVFPDIGKSYEINT